MPRVTFIDALKNLIKKKDLRKLKRFENRNYLKQFILNKMK